MSLWLHYQEGGRCLGRHLCLLAYHLLPMRDGVGTLKPRYVPPMDSKEQHLPGMNYAGPGTNVGLRRRKGIRPMDALDKAALEHDIVTEPRGPYTSKGNPRKLRAADRKLMHKATALAASGYRPKWKAVAVAGAMAALLKTGARGRKIQ